jgi:hypothetical protein
MYIINSNTGLLEPSSGGGVNYGDAAELIPELNQLNGSSQGSLPADKLAAALESKEAVASAIEAKGVEVANAPFSEYAAKIREIKAATPKVEGTPGNGFPVRFFDYDGTLLKTHYVHKGEDATPPELPEHEYLSFQRWNNGYTNIQGPTDTGACYNTQDGASYFFLSFVKGDSLTMYLRHTVTGGSSVIEWGDGSVDTNDGTSEFVTTHTYPAYGEYIIRLSASAGAKIKMSDCFTAYKDQWIDFSKNASVRRIVYSGSIEQEAMPAGESTGLRYYSAPRGWRYQHYRSYGGAASLRAVIGANTNESIGCRNDKNLDAVVYYDKTPSIGVNYFDYTCPSVIIPETVSSFRADLPSGIDKVVFRRKEPATAPYIDASPKIGKVYVPQGSLEAYKSATGWSALADIMEEYTEETILW